MAGRGLCFYTSFTRGIYYSVRSALIAGDLFKASVASYYAVVVTTI